MYNTVITYGTFDLFHVGHLNILRRARELGHRLVVGVSSDEFNISKGKKCVIPYEQRKDIVASVRYVDECFAENDWQQKQDDIVKYGADLFVMGDDWRGKFDDLSGLCKIQYLDRTPNISTTELKATLKVLDRESLDKLVLALRAASSIAESLS
jgi:glycerol-3-phosphate cytidylyltransferase